MSRYHIAYGKRILLKDGSTVSFDEVELLEPIHDYDVGTRHEHGMSQGEHEPNKFLEDYLHDNFVVILETGDSTYRHKRGTDDDADSEE